MREIVEKALQSRKPEEYSRMKASGDLDGFLESRTNAAMDEIAQARSIATTKVAREDNPDFLKKVQSLTMADKAAEEQAIANAIDF